MSGWIKLHRSMRTHWIYNEKPFSKFQAWMDILLSANHKDNKFVLGTELLEVERGSFITSELKLMERWGWSKTKVRSFLELLENDKMIIKLSDRKKTTLTIVNYDVYQDRETTERPQENHEKTIKKPIKDTNKNDKKEKNEKNDKELYISIVEYLNSKTNKNFKSTSKTTQNIINARINEGFTIDDFKKVIDHKTTSWINDVKMSEYLRPQTLFGTKFESYLNEGGIKGGELKGNNGTNINKRTASEESLRLERIAKETGLLDENGRCKPIGEIPF